MPSCVVYGPPVGEWVAKQTGGHFDKERTFAIGMASDGYVVAGILFEDWNRASFVCHMAASGRLTREFLWTVADYAFRHAKARKLIAPIYSTNTRMVRMAFKMGFTPEASIADAQPDGDILIFTMTAARCRFLGDRYGKTASTCTA